MSNQLTNNLNSTWLILKRVKKQSFKNSPLNSLKFPLNYSEAYEIGSSSDNDLVIPCIFDETVPKVIIQVERNKIIIENVSSPEDVNNFKINDAFREPRRKFTIRINDRKFLARFQFGPKNCLYQLFRCAAPNNKFYDKLRNLTACVNCLEAWKEPVPLPCGHVVCANCANELNSKTMNNAEDMLEVSQEAFLFEMSTVDCPKCLQKMMINQISEITILTTLGEDHKKKFLPFAASSCAQCQNKRCLALECDYWKCVPCMRYLCPLCVLDGHRDHELLFGYTKMHVTLRNFYRESHKVKLSHYQKLKRDEECILFKCRELLYVLEGCKKTIRDDELAIKKLLMTADLLYSKLKNPRLDDNSAFEDLTLFQAIIENLRSPVESVTIDIKKKINILRKYQSRMPVLWNEYGEYVAQMLNFYIMQILI